MIITASRQTAPLLPVYGFGQSSQDPFQFPRPAGLERAIGLDERNGSTFVRANISWVDPELRNSYNGGNFAIRQRASRGLLYQVAYTFGKRSITEAASAAAPC